MSTGKHLELGATLDLDLIGSVNNTMEFTNFAGLENPVGIARDFPLVLLVSQKKNTRACTRVYYY